MARYVDAIDLPLPTEQAFAYLADFSNTQAWDPGVVSAQRLARGEIGLGSRFRFLFTFKLSITSSHSSTSSLLS